MHFEKTSNNIGDTSEKNLEKLNIEIDRLSREGQNAEALALIEQLPDNEDKAYKIAYIGMNYIDQGDLVSAEEIAEKLSADANHPEYGAGVLEQILRTRGEITELFD